MKQQRHYVCVLCMYVCVVYVHVIRHACAAMKIFTVVISQSVTQWSKARARFTTGIPKNTGINIVGRYTHEEQRGTW